MRLEVAEFIDLLFVARYEDINPGGLLAPVGSGPWLARRQQFDSTRKRLLLKLIFRLYRAHRKQTNDLGISWIGAPLGNPSARLRVELSVDEALFAAQFLSTERRGLFGRKRDVSHLTDSRRGAWLFSYKCSQAISARRGRPSHTRTTVDASLNNSSGYHVRHVRRLAALANRIEKQMATISLPGGLLTRYLKLTD